MLSQVDIILLTCHAIKIVLIYDLNTFVYIYLNIDILKPPVDAVTASLAADNVIVAFYFMFLFAITVPEKIYTKSKQIRISNAGESVDLLDTTENPQNEITPKSSSKNGRSDITLTSLSQAISLALLLYTLSIGISTKINASPMIVVSLLTVLVATLFPQQVGSISRSGGIIGVLIMQVGNTGYIL